MEEWRPQTLQPSFGQVIRQLKRREGGVYNCINSVLADAAFIGEVAALYPGFPVLANLRCGLWYVAEPAGTCYFKSTDGHFGKWTFSLTRLNLSVAFQAADGGGVLIVDATRRGKTFPDALAKTVPIWAAVVNRAVAVHRARAAPARPVSAGAQTSGSQGRAAPDQPAPGYGLALPGAGCAAVAPCATPNGCGAGPAAAEWCSTGQPRASSPAVHSGRGATGDEEALHAPGGDSGPCEGVAWPRVVGRCCCHAGDLPAGLEPGRRCDVCCCVPAGPTAACALGRTVCGCGCGGCGGGSATGGPAELLPGRSDFGAGTAADAGPVSGPHLKPAEALRAGVAAGSSGAGEAQEELEACPWDTALHLPPWVPATERSQIEERLDGFVSQLLEVGAGVPALAAALAKPLRPLWVSQATRVWLDAVPDARSLPFAPLVLVSASLPGARQRRVVGGGGWSYEYVPGAGDDEESWARGLTPALLMRHRRELVAAGPEGIEGAVSSLLAEQSGPAAAAGPPAPGAAPPAAGPPAHASAAASAAVAPPPPQHRLLPLGCRPEPGLGSGPGGGGACADDSIFWVAGTGIGVGAHAAGAPATAWAHVGAVLNLGARQHSGMQAESAAAKEPRPREAACAPPDSQDRPSPGAMHPARQRGYGAGGAGEGAGLPRYLWLPVAGPKQDRFALQGALPAALGFVAGQRAARRRVLVHCDDGLDRCVCVAVAALLAGCGASQGAQAFSPGALDRPLVPSRGAGASAARSRGEGGAAEGEDGDSDQWPAAAAPCSNSGVAADGSWQACSGRTVLSGGPQRAGCEPDVRSSAAQPTVPYPTLGRPVSRCELRRQLAVVSACYPAARPSKGMLRQVFNYFRRSEE